MSGVLGKIVPLPLLLMLGCYASGITPRRNFEYRVRSGDTLYNISQRYHVSVTELRNINRISDPRALEIGQVLKIPELLDGGRYAPTGIGGAGPRANQLKHPLRMVSLGKAQRYVGQLAWPLPIGAARMSSTFDWRWNSFHEGLDLAAPQGTPVYAAHAGQVLQARRRGGYGNIIVIRGEGLVTVYGHNRSVRVDKGERVERGELIGYVGQTGNASGPHLHFETRIWDPAADGYAAVDPRTFYRR